MESLRVGTFETNSSSCHELTLGKNPRPLAEFPLPNEDGIIVIEVKPTDWGAIDFSPSPKTFMEFIMLGIGMMACGENPFRESYSHSDQKRFLKWINAIYKMLDLPVVKGIKIPYNSDINLMSDGSGNSSPGNWYINTPDDFQGNGLDTFFFSLARDIKPENEKIWMTRALEKITDEEYDEDTLVYNAALAMIVDSTGEIGGN